MLVMGLVLGPSLMIISIAGILLYAIVYPLYNVLWECIVVVYKLNFDKSLHIASLDTTCVHNFRPVPITFPL